MSLYQKIERIQNQQLNHERSIFKLGETVRIGLLIQEGKKQRVQTFQGTLIAQHRSGRSSTFTIRRIFQGIGIERVFFLHTTSIQQITTLRCAKVRRAKLYYLRTRTGKAARLRQRFTKIEQSLL